MCDGRERLREVAGEAARLASPSYPAYLRALWRSNALRRLWGRVAPVFRWVSRILRWLERSTLVIAGAVLLTAVGLPVLLAVGVVVLCGYSQHRHCNAVLRRALRGRRVYVCFASPDVGIFFRGTVRALAETGAAVIVVSPYLWRSGGRPYLTMRRVGAGVYLIRRHYWFSLFRRVLSGMRDNLTLIY